VAAGVAKAKADTSRSRATTAAPGASPWSSIKHAGTPGNWVSRRDAADAGPQPAARAHRWAGRRPDKDWPRRGDRRNPGRRRIGFATGRWFVEAASMMRKCHLKTPAGRVATQTQVLRKRFAGKPEYVINSLLRRRRGRALMAKLRDTQIQRPDRPHRSARHEEGHRSLEREGPGFRPDIPCARRRRRVGATTAERRTRRRALDNR